MVIRKLPPMDAAGLLESLRRIPAKIHMAITGFGALGDPAFIPLVMGQMQVPELARPAGEAFSMLTGVDIAYQDLEGEWPERFEAGPTEDPKDEDVVMEPDEDLLWSDVELIQTWWEQNKSNYKTEPGISWENPSVWKPFKMYLKMAPSASRPQLPSNWP
ncbi:hypothetical protein [uncultured Desulfosarcina sp.]|uniref:hypothetical protein n=1 Tax=uncultured Desulfosarcina sp. TaxID=218289 RepID=UPI0029C60EC1|nr:hypothetical protein [uncultured Desulfosarcina sp.]